VYPSRTTDVHKGRTAAGGGRVRLDLVVDGVGGGDELRTVAHDDGFVRRRALEVRLHHDMLAQVRLHVRLDVELVTSVDRRHWRLEQSTERFIVCRRRGDIDIRMMLEFVTETVLCCVVHARAMRTHVHSELELDHGGRCSGFWYRLRLSNST